MRSEGARGRKSERAGGREIEKGRKGEWEKKSDVKYNRVKGLCHNHFLFNSAGNLSNCCS
ncbi:MAG: hypothetical protein AMS27_01605 [Bacteroides sp. SM23_62_1]|nr:MAG: hypothetical protein AMS27_01605 [Bacteroides sp. SM23_62_1]